MTQYELEQTRRVSPGQAGYISHILKTMGFVPTFDIRVDTKYNFLNRESLVPLEFRFENDRIIFSGGNQELSFPSHLDSRIFPFLNFLGYRGDFSSGILHRSQKAPQRGYRFSRNYRLGEGNIIEPYLSLTSKKKLRIDKEGEISHETVLELPEQFRLEQRLSELLSASKKRSKQKNRETYVLRNGDKTCLKVEFCEVRIDGQSLGTYLEIEYLIETDRNSVAGEIDLRNIFNSKIGKILNVAKYLGVGDIPLVSGSYYDELKSLKAPQKGTTPK